ncbi:hypothetical protein HELRODRAFT_175765 [Helobdella robusta]|uniref:Endonuclease/exonuclease/phosphatase domain-containing protein n=1 Tax=Helobdella robusta TaxID=6412 RepID=T1F9M3_HELRO|nr:hypothetical protein HELRODRAFT_175765 [Helobdella robusta]ESO00355.1 hypothetical protein HELRODRAFT_175765 [Helobdella robusta]
MSAHVVYAHFSKTAIVKPMLKKAGLAPDVASNYRPISNLTFVSKVVEKIVARQLSVYLSKNSLYLSKNSLLPKVQPDGQVRKGGGLALIYNEVKFKLKHYELGRRFETFEALACLIKIRSAQMLSMAIYRPGSVASGERFIDEIFNFLFMVPSLVWFSWLIHQPIYVSGNILDLVLVNGNMTVLEVRVQPPMVSDHSLVVSEFMMTMQRRIKDDDEVRYYRDCRRVKDSDVMSMLKSSPLCSNLENLVSASQDDFCEIHTSTFSEITKHLAFLKMVAGGKKKSAPWLNDSCFHERRCARRCDRIFRRTRTTSDIESWRKQLTKLHDLYDMKMRLFWMSKVANSRRNQKNLWNLLNRLLGNEQQ